MRQRFLVALAFGASALGSGAWAIPVPRTDQPPAAVAPDDAVALPRAPAPAAVHPAPAARAIASHRVGRVERIEPIRERPPGTGKGAVIGGVLGGVVGNQFGHGGGRAAMTVLGAAGGAVAGNNVERNINKRVVGYRVTVRLDNGRWRTYEESRLNGLRVGDRVRIDGRQLRRA